MGSEFKKLDIPEVILVTPKAFKDDRGFFLESYKKSEFKLNGIDVDFRQDNHSKSSKGVLRGLHYQLEPHGQGKLIRVVTGKIFDVAVDIREGSPTFGKWVSAELSEENKQMLWIPSGFAHGFLTLEDNTNVLYKATNEYDKDSEGGIIWNDPDIGIKWPVNEPTLSEKDIKNVSLKEAKLNFRY